MTIEMKRKKSKLSEQWNKNERERTKQRTKTKLTEKHTKRENGFQCHTRPCGCFQYDMST